MSVATNIAISEPSAVPSFNNNLTSGIDLSEFSHQQVMEIQLYVGQFRMSQQRLGKELLYMTQQLVWLQEILKEKFQQFAYIELKIQPRTLRRYLSVNKVLRAKFMTDGEINYVQASQFTQNALVLLSPETDEEVMTELRAMADKGVKIDEQAVRKLLESQNQDYEARLASTQAEADAAIKELEAIKTQRELEVARLERKLSSNEELLRRAAENKAALEEENAKLQKSTTTVEIQEVEVVPAGYKSTMEAVNEAKRALADANAQVEQLKKRSEEIKASIAELECGADEVMKLKSQVDTLLTKYPVSRLKALSSADGNIQALIAGLGHSMIEMGRQLTTATA